MAPRKKNARGKAPVEDVSDTASSNARETTQGELLLAMKNMMREIEQHRLEMAAQRNTASGRQSERTSSRQTKPTSSRQSIPVSSRQTKPTSSRRTEPSSSRKTEATPLLISLKHPERKRE